MKVISKEYLYLPIFDENMLNANIGNEIELVKYGENGSIAFSTKGKLISNVTTPVFEIDEKIVINPPYNYRFSEIPDCKNAICFYSNRFRFKRSQST